MTYKDVYTAALTLTGDAPASSNASYENRAGYILPMVVASLLPLDRIVRRNAGKKPTPMPPPNVDLASEWPLDDEFFPVAAYYLASELLSSDDPEESSSLYVEAEAMRRILSDAIPYTVESV